MPVFAGTWREEDGAPYIPHQIFHHGATWKDSGVISILSLGEPEKRRETEAGAWSAAHQQGDLRTRQEGTNPRSQGIMPFTSSTAYQVCELGEVFNPFVPP